MTHTGIVGELEEELGFIVGQIEEVTNELKELQEQKADVQAHLEKIMKVLNG